MGRNIKEIIKEMILILWYAWTNVSLLAAKLTASHVVTFDLEFVIKPQITSQLLQCAGWKKGEDFSSHY